MEHIYGRRPVLSVLENPRRQIKFVTIQKDLPSNTTINDIVDVANKRNIKIEYVSDTKLERQFSMGQRRHQGVVATTSDFKYFELSNLLDNLSEKPFILILDHINDPHNLGAIVRSAELAGVDGVIVPDRRNSPISNTVVKTSAGATEKVPIIKVTNINDTIRKIKKLGIKVYAIEIGGTNIYTKDLTDGLAFVLGSEGEGIHKLTLELSDEILTIPMFGYTNSLNVSVASGIVLFETARQRN